MTSKRWLLVTMLCVLVFTLAVAPVAAPGVRSADQAPQGALPGTQAPDGQKVDRTGYIKGFYVSHAALGDAGFMKHVQDLLTSTELNAVVMDFKSDRGQLTFPTQVPMAHEIGADREITVPDAAPLMKWFADRNVYTIARIPIFKDNALAQAHPEWAVTHAGTGAIWRDPEGMGWVDPNYEQVGDYNIALAQEAAALGFDEVQFDYVRFPTDGNVGAARFAGPNTFENRTAAIAGLLQRTRDALKQHGVKLAADVFGYTAWVSDDLGIGQQIEALAPHIDVLSPMVYPSTYNAGLPGESGRYRNAIAYPYDIVFKSTDRTVKRARAVNPKIDIRPWIQDFQDYAFDYRTYTPDEIRLQMDGVREAGGRGWLLWDPAVRYTPKALVSARPAYLPNLVGKAPVIAYRDIAENGGPGSRTPAELRGDLERLLAEGYYPVNLRDMVEGKLNMAPAGKRPVVLTFDGSTPGQFRLLPNGAADPATAVGVLMDFHAAHPADWPLKATFFVRGSPIGAEPGAEVFGTPEVAALKLKLLTEWGMEVGSEIAGQPRLDGLSPDEVQRIIGQNLAPTAALLPGYRIASLALPDGRAPKDLELLRNGVYDGQSYSLAAAVAPGGGLAPSPLTPQFDPYRIPRVPAAELDAWLKAANRADILYVSAGEALQGAP